MPRLASSNPKYQKHRASGQAVVTLDGQDFYLGPFGSKASKMEYDRLIGEWLANGRRLARHTAYVTVAEILEAYLRFAEGYYTAPACGYASEWETTKQALRYPALLYSATPADVFGPLALKTCRESMIKDGLCRTHINQQVGRIKRMFKWAVEQELIGDVPAATAILDRFLHNAEVIAITGKSYRLRNQPKTAEPGKAAAEAAATTVAEARA